MTAPVRSLLRRTPLLAGLALVASSLALPVQAQYKVVGPDGKVTYTDLAPSSSAGKVSTLNSRSSPVPIDVPLPTELRQAVNRYPVILYTTGGTCDPCEQARTLLRQRGIPYAEKQAITAEDADALQRITGGRDAPTLAIGAQILRGLASEVWQGYLDSAGYPRDSRLPAGYQNPPATPLTERKEAAATPAPAPRPTPAAPQAPAAPAPGGIRF